jgi:2-amino-4-hydroxy-6-hydroxymethyldihydropteridine diphosphokinase
VTRRAALALGANLGDRTATMQAAVAELAETPGVRVAAVSTVYETTPVGGPPGQPPYLNAVVVVDTDLEPADLLRRAHEVEAAHGRVRDERWGPRTLDVDLLAVGDVRSGAPELTLPHPRAHERAFVLVPWAEVDPTFPVSGLGTVSELLDRLGPAAGSGVRARPDLVLRGPAGTEAGR